MIVLHNKFLVISIIIVVCVSLSPSLSTQSSKSVNHHDAVKQPQQQQQQQVSTKSIVPSSNHQQVSNSQSAVKSSLSGSRKPPSAARPILQLQQQKQQNKTDNQSPSKGEPQKGVFPADANNDNSQIVYVDLNRVVDSENNSSTTQSSGGNNNTNQQPTRVTSDAIAIKRDETIECGETNRCGQPSLNNASVSSSASQLPDRIVGGTRAEPGEFPYQVRLNIRSRRGSSLCGGVIIDQRHILTAAHCLTTCSYFVSTSSVDASAVQATIGDLRITVQDGEQTIKIDKVSVHERYSACSYTHNNYDIAMLRTAQPMSWIFTDDGYGSVNRVCLPHAGQDYESGDRVTVSGWGVMQEGEGQISNVLNAVDVPVVSVSECKQTYGSRVNHNHVCAGLREGGKDSCQGDSGGPLVRTMNGRAELVGIVSFGYGCAQERSPGVYTKVSSYVDWINKHL